MGSYEREENITDPAELDYGRQFRKANFEFFESGALPKVVTPYTGDHEWFYSTKTDSLVKKSILKDKCDQFDQIDLYMEIWNKIVVISCSSNTGHLYQQSYKVICTALVTTSDIKLS